MESAEPSATGGTHGACYGMFLTILGPIAFDKANGMWRHTRGPQESAASSGDGVLFLPLRLHWYQCSCSSLPPHCRLNRCVPLPGVHRPKLNSVTPSAAHRSMNDQYSSMLGAAALYSRREDAHVISNSPPQRNPHPAA